MGMVELDHMEDVVELEEVAGPVVDRNGAEDVVEIGNEEVPVTRVSVLVVAGAVTISSVRPQTMFNDTGRDVT